MYSQFNFLQVRSQNATQMLHCVTGSVVEGRTCFCSWNIDTCLGRFYKKHMTRWTHDLGRDCTGTFELSQPVDMESTRCSPREKQGTPRVTCTQLKQNCWGSDWVKLSSAWSRMVGGQFFPKWTDGQSKIKRNCYFFKWEPQIIMVFSQDTHTHHTLAHLSVPVLSRFTWATGSWAAREKVPARWGYMPALDTYWVVTHKKKINFAFGSFCDAGFPLVVTAPHPKASLGGFSGALECWRESRLERFTAQRNWT